MRELSSLSPSLVQQAVRREYAESSDGYRPTVGKLLTVCRRLAEDERLDQTGKRLRLPEPEPTTSCERALGKLAADVVAEWQARDEPEKASEPSEGSQSPATRRRSGPPPMTEMIVTEYVPERLRPYMKSLCFVYSKRRRCWHAEVPSSGIETARAMLAEIPVSAEVVGS